jgi:hypothetical protein
VNNLIILICIHNRANLLEPAPASLNAEKQPAMPVQILVAANACTDDTLARKRAYQSQQAGQGWPPLRVIDAPMPGKSHTLKLGGPATLVKVASKETELFLRMGLAYYLKNPKDSALLKLSLRENAHTNYRMEQWV